MTLVFPEGGKNASSDFFGFSLFLLFFKIRTKLLWFCLCCNFFFFLLFLSVPYIFIYKDMNIFISEIGGYNVDSIENCFFFLYCI